MYCEIIDLYLHQCQKDDFEVYSVVPTARIINHTLYGLNNSATDADVVGL